jgi:hypothetical protein
MLAAVGFNQVATSLIKPAPINLHNDHPFQSLFLTSRTGKLLLAIFLLYPLINAFSSSLELSSYFLTKEQRQAIAWIRENTPPKSHFLILAFEGTFKNPFQEWLPSLSNRVNVAVEVGYEWMPDGAFEKRRNTFFAINRCVFEPITCVESWAKQYSVGIDYIVVYQGLLTPVDYKLGNQPINSMKASPDYQMVYESELIKIFRRVKSD